jgi:hypothetical protein
VRRARAVEVEESILKFAALGLVLEPKWLEPKWLRIIIHNL